MSASEDIARENALSPLRDKDGEQWIDPHEITDRSAPYLIAARDVLLLLARLEQRVDAGEPGEGVRQKPDVAEAGELLLDALNAFDDKWYPMLAGVGIGEAHLGHDEIAARWGAMCREFRALVADAHTESVWPGSTTPPEAAPVPGSPDLASQDGECPGCEVCELASELIEERALVSSLARERDEYAMGAAAEAQHADEQQALVAVYRQALEHIASLPDLSGSARRRADALAREALAAAVVVGQPNGQDLRDASGVVKSGEGA